MRLRRLESRAAIKGSERELRNSERLQRENTFVEVGKARQIRSWKKRSRSSRRKQGWRHQRLMQAQRRS
jgi:hypothetical protein